MQLKREQLNTSNTDGCNCSWTQKFANACTGGDGSRCWEVCCGKAGNETTPQPFLVPAKAEADAVAGETGEGDGAWRAPDGHAYLTLRRALQPQPEPQPEPQPQPAAPTAP